MAAVRLRDPLGTILVPAIRADSFLRPDLRAGNPIPCAVVDGDVCDSGSGDVFCQAFPVELIAAEIFRNSVPGVAGISLCLASKS